MAGTEELTSSFGSVFLRFTRLLDKRMAREGASLARTRVLLMIERRGPVKASDIAELFGLAPRTVTDTLDGMERQGLIRREPDPKDRRAKRILITEAGRQAVAATEPIRRELTSQVMGSLDGEEREALARILGKLDAAVVIAEQEEDRSARQ
jgi:DNA-binding MarR family transcriptional regulator